MKKISSHAKRAIASHAARIDSSVFSFYLLSLDRNSVKSDFVFSTRFSNVVLL